MLPVFTVDTNQKHTSNQTAQQNHIIVEKINKLIKNIIFFINYSRC